MVTPERMLRHLQAEDSELDYIKEDILPQAIAYVTNYINRNSYPLEDVDDRIFDRCVLFVSSTWYLNRQGQSWTSKKLMTSDVTGLNMILDSIRIPGIGSVND